MSELRRFPSVLMTNFLCLVQVQFDSKCLPQMQTENRFQTDRFCYFIVCLRAERHWVCHSRCSRTRLSLPCCKLVAMWLCCPFSPQFCSPTPPPHTHTHTPPPPIRSSEVPTGRRLCWWIDRCLCRNSTTHPLTTSPLSLPGTKRRDWTALPYHFGTKYSEPHTPLPHSP
jgi:hypothetical protein